VINSMQEIFLKSSDGKRIAVNYHPKDGDKVIVLAHGFFNNKDAYLFREIARELNKHFAVVAFDFRGHGKSSGLFTWTSREGNDLKAVLDYTCGLGYKKLGLAGFSLGAALSLIAASHDKRIDSVMAVSAPCSFWGINMHFWEREMLNDMMLNLGAKGKGKGIRPGNIFLKKVKPIDIVDKITVPVYFFHGENDWIIKPYHSTRLFEKALCEKKITIMPGTGHAEKIFDVKAKEFIDECVKWFDNTLK
jgi:pimeloyl-ACP methyl ester carboxylesterase